MTATSCPSSTERFLARVLRSSLLLTFRLGDRSRWSSWMLGVTTVIGVLCSSALPGLAAEIRVAIEEQVSQVNLGSSTQAMIRNGAGQVLAEVPAGGGFVAQANGGQVAIAQWRSNQFWVEPSGNGYVYIGDKWYRGRTQVIASPGGLTAINYVDLEHYLYSVVGGEMPANWHLEALKAQAVAARSYALYKQQRTRNALFDVSDTTASQVYQGLIKEASTTHAAVEQTRGQVLTYNGQIVEAVFHSSSGGHTENVEDVWSNALPYLRGVVDFDHYAPVFQWSQQFSAEQLRQRITGVGNVISLVPERTTPRGRVVSMRVVGDQGSRVLSGNEIRQALGLKSTLFAVAPQMAPIASTRGVGSTPMSFYVTGRGFGHGVGMSQWGAYGMAAQGYNYQQILGHYYQGVSLARIQ